MIENINNPMELKKLNFDELKILASEVRKTLLRKASVCGGHVGSNLGIVEITIALHYVFQSPIDKFVFDVSHQCYTHKILTGRKSAFLNPMFYSEVSGFTNPAESEHDLFRIGHSATSISLACGLAKARDIKNAKENIIAIIGDAALGGGEAFEGLNFAGSELCSNLIIIVNDNQMSIADNHGGLYKNLKELRDSSGLCNHNIFKSLGLDYRYVENGNDLESIISVLTEINNIDHPIIIHVNTKKGKGYKFSEEDKEDWHWRRPFNLETGELTHPFNGESYDKILNDFLLEKMSKDRAVVAFVAGVPLTAAFTKEKRMIAGKQFVDVGIMEEHAISMAAGVAANGGKPVFTTDCTFYQRVYDQIAQDVCINKLPVTMLIRNATVWGMTDVTHLGFFDIALFSNIPNLVYLAPTNREEYFAMLDWSIEQKEHPVAIKIPRYVLNAKYEINKAFDDINKFQIVEQGNKVAILALGDFFEIGENIRMILKEKANISATLINPRFASGVDTDMLTNLQKDHSIFITLEDGIIEGGFGQKISSFLGESKNISIKNYGLKKKFLDRYNIKDVMIKNRLVPELIVDDILKSL